MNLRNGTILDLRNNTKPPEDLKEWNEKNEEMQNSTSKEYGELIAVRKARRKDT